MAANVLSSQRAVEVSVPAQSIKEVTWRFLSSGKVLSLETKLVVCPFTPMPWQPRNRPASFLWTDT